MSPGLSPCSSAGFNRPRRAGCRKLKTWPSSLNIAVVGVWRSGRLGLEVDAFAWTMLRGVDRVVLIAGSHDQASRVRVGEDRIAVVDVADAIFEDNEEIRAPIDAQPCTGTTVLVDPYEHQHPNPH